MAVTGSAETYELNWGAGRSRAFPLRLARSMVRFARRKPLGLLGLLFVVGILFTALLAPTLAPYSPNKLDLRHRLQGSTARHRLGTDSTGKDILSRLIYGARISMTVGFGAVAISSVGAAVLGMVSGYAGGWVDTLLQRFIDAWQALPGLIILITFLGIVRRLPNVNIVLAMILAIGVLGIAGLSRVIRSAVLSLRASPFIEAAQASGSGSLRILVYHILPNVFPLILVTATVGLVGVILAEASLS
ncbi:MAG: ABC transporter permease, partial [Dehalococcoidia bacterium]